MTWRTALNRLTHALMVVTMLLHGILGCCWHHGHAAACASEARRVVSPQAAPSAACCHHHHHQAPKDTDSPGSDPSSNEPAAPVPHEHECADEVCVYVGSKAPELSPPVALLPAVGDVDELLSDAPMLTSVLRTVDAPPRYQSSLTSCALLQVWRL